MFSFLNDASASATYELNGVTATLLDDGTLTISGSGGGGAGPSTGVILKIKNNLSSATVYCVDD